MKNQINPADSVKILLADDHSMIREGLKQMLTHEIPNVELGEASNAKEVFKLVKEKKWDLLIMDINMPGKDGLDVLQQLKDEKTDVRVLILSMHPEEHMGLRAIKSGAFGYLNKEICGEEFINAINQILRGKKYITSSLAEQMAIHLDDPTNKKPYELLSNREYQTLQLIALGKTVSQIAAKLCLSVPTVSTYRSRILDKMCMKTNAELTSYSIRNALV